MTDTSAIPPALTLEQWAAWENEDDANGLGYGVYALNHQPDVTDHEFQNYADGVVASTGYPGEQFSPDDRDRHALAALCLYGQPFGFTQEDVELLMRCATGCDGTISAEDDERVYPDGIVMRMRDVHRFWSLAEKIAALLPPARP